MTYTGHGHQILGSPENNLMTDGTEWDGTKARCGGQGICLPCSTEAVQFVMKYNEDPVPGRVIVPETLLDQYRIHKKEYHDDQTLMKVLDGLAAAGLSFDQARDAIREMQNRGILFRERLSDGLQEGR